MRMREVVENGHKIVIVEAENQETVINDTQSALDLMMTVQYTFQTNRMVIDKAAVCEKFFILSTGLAGEILQKYINYGVKLAIFGDFTHYTSKPLQDFIRESNRGKDFFFVSDEQEAVRKLCLAE